MTELINRVSDLSKYEFGIGSLVRPENKDILPVIITKIGFLTLQGMALGGAVYLNYQGQTKRALAAVAAAGILESLKFFYHQLYSKNYPAK